VVYLCLIWWLGSTLIGIVIGRGSHASPAISRLLAGARSQTLLPELHPSRTLANRLWPLLLVTVFTLMVGLAWRKQPSAVQAIEERDGVRFYVERTSPLAAIRLVRTPGFGGDFLRAS
jgi:H+/Cl- antiporter ClcA